MDPDRWRRATTPIPVIMVVLIIAGTWTDAAHRHSRPGITVASVVTVLGVLYIGWALRRAYGSRD